MAVHTEHLADDPSTSQGHIHSPNPTTPGDSYQVGALLGDETLFAGPGSLIIKPRGEWHTFWNAADVPARILEIISPGGLEDLFRELDLLQSELSPEAFTKRAARYGTRIDMERTMEVVERHALKF